MKRILTGLLMLGVLHSNAQSRLISWGMNDVENLTEDVFNAARTTSPEQWLNKNKNAKTWCDVFLCINNVAEYKSDTELMLGFAEQLTDTSTTYLTGTSRLIIWDRIISEDLIFHGKGIVVDNDLFTVAGRANQILQSALNKNFGYVSMDTDFKTLQDLKEKWGKAIRGETADEWQKPKRNYDNTIEEVSNLKAFEAIVMSVQPSDEKDIITSRCLKMVYKLDAMPDDPGSEAYCNPDTYSFGYLAMLTGESPLDKNKDAKYWKSFWNKNKDNLIWDNDKGCFVIQ